MKNSNVARKTWTAPRITEVAGMSEAQGNKFAIYLIEAYITIGGIGQVAIGPAS